MFHFSDHFSDRDKRKKRKREQIEEIWDDFSDTGSTFDVLGSYTGFAAGDSKPEQDADDL